MSASDVLQVPLERPPAAARFELALPWALAGDQAAASSRLLDGLARGDKDQVLLGVTGSGKTVTMAKVIAESARPALVLAHNKTLAAQLYGEF
ncbi:MAG: DEAD/DEAH box helicase family protein, partial [Candidatus Limnocylindria bacterium]